MKIISKNDKVHTFEISINDLIEAIIGANKENLEEGIGDADTVKDLIDIRDEIDHLITNAQLFKEGEDTVAINKAFKIGCYFRGLMNEEVAEEAVEKELEIVLEVVYGNNKRITITNDNIVF